MNLNKNITALKIKDLEKIYSSSLFWIISFTVLTALAAQITIPVKPVPFTLQTVIVLLAGAFLGAKNGFYSQVLYLLIGITGLPVFAHIPEGTLGLARILGPTGGYLLAFPIAAFFTGLLIERNQKYYAVFFAILLGNIIILLLGALYLNLFLNNINEALIAGAGIFSIWTIAKVSASTAIFLFLKRK